jgi:hypothetical protein
MRKIVFIFITSMLLSNIGLANDRDRNNRKLIIDVIHKNDSILHLMDSSIVNKIKLNELDKRLTSLIVLDFRIEEFQNLCDFYNINIRSYQSFYNLLDKSAIIWQNSQEGKTLYTIIQLSKNNLIFALKNQAIIDSLETLHSKIKDTYKVIDSAKYIISTSKDEIEKASEQILNVQDEICEVKNDIAIASARIEKVTVSLDSLNEELKTSIGCIKKLDRKVTGIQYDIDQQRKQINLWGIGLGVGNIAAIVLLVILL